VPDAGGPAALDGSLTTAWTTPFGEALGATLRVPLASPLDGPFVVRQPVDGLHSRITRLTLRSGDGEELSLDVPMPDPDGRSTVDPGAALQRSTANGAVLEVRIDAIDPVAVTDRRYAEQVTLPASIVEIEGLPVAASGAAPVAGCHRGLLSIDGRAVGVEFGDEVAARLRAGESVEVPLCGADSGALELSAGAHRLVSTEGSATGVHVNQVVLSSVDIPMADGGAIDGQASHRIEASTERTRTTRTADVEACPEGCWLVLGEGYNPAWNATTADGTSLGPPLQVSGGFNGWWLEPSDTERTVIMTWTPQRSLDAALLIAASGVLACLALVATDRRHHRAQVARVPGPRLVLLPQLVDRRSAAVGAVVLVVGSALVIAPVWGVIALVPAAWYAAARRPGLLVVSAAAGAALIGLLVIARQYRFRYLPDAAWPGHFEDVHRVGLFIVVLVVVGALTGDQDTAIETTAGPRNDSLTQ
jgi:arabinofuranan 3-O-arabinosyltransferase